MIHSVEKHKIRKKKTKKAPFGVCSPIAPAAAGEAAGVPLPAGAGGGVSDDVTDNTEVRGGGVISNLVSVGVPGRNNTRTVGVEA